MSDIDLNHVVTLVVHHHVKAGHREPYEAWLRRAVAAAKAAQGHLGVNVIRPQQAEDGVFTTVVRFADAEQLQNWINSEQRLQLIEEVLPLLEDGDHPMVHADAEFWFTPPSPDTRKPPQWKQAVLTFLVISPLSMIIPQLWQPLFLRFPALGGLVPSNLLITFCIVVLVVFLIMPTVTRWFAGWLNAH
jgi:antibiotic biosynthesis monooxygenase (ABM) superfamily enzyme